MTSGAFSTKNLVFLFLFPLAHFVFHLVLLVLPTVPLWADSATESFAISPTAKHFAGARAEKETRSAALDGGVYELTVQHFTAAIESGGLDDIALSRAYSSRATALAKLGQNELAISNYTVALDLDMDNSEAWRGRAIAHNVTGQFEKAINDINELSDRPGNTAETHYVWATPNPASA